MKITSSAFGEGQRIPAKNTCDGENINPSLSIDQIPQGTTTLALIVDDPDAPGGDWVHWLVWNMDPNISQIPENWHEDHITFGTTSFGKPGYGGPCPHQGTHRYFFKLYALDKIIDLPPTADKKQLLLAIDNHILDKAELAGLYSRK